MLCISEKCIPVSPPLGWHIGRHMVSALRLPGCWSRLPHSEGYGCECFLEPRWASVSCTCKMEAIIVPRAML